MTAREKVLDVEQQVRVALAAGAIAITLRCPFCNVETELHEGAYLCCEKLYDTTEAIMEHIEFLQQRENLDRVMDKLASMSSKALLN
jgi:hypothetical protein